MVYFVNTFTLKVFNVLLFCFSLKVCKILPVLWVLKQFFRNFGLKREKFEKKAPPVFTESRDITLVLNLELHKKSPTIASGRLPISRQTYHNWIKIYRLTAKSIISVSTLYSIVCKKSSVLWIFYLFFQILTFSS